MNIQDWVDGFFTREGDDNETQEHIRDLSFTNYLKIFTSIMEGMETCGAKSLEEILMPQNRYFYFLVLFKNIQHITGENTVSHIVHKGEYGCCLDKFCSDQHALELYGKCKELSAQQKKEICLCVEKYTRGQTENCLWDLVREKMFTGSRFHAVSKNYSDTSELQRAFNEVSKQNPGDFFNRAISFGLRCEEPIKKILANLIFTHTICHIDFGLLMSPGDGMFGASMDMAVGVTEDESGLLSFTPQVKICEVKCRYKYLFSPSSDSITCQKYTKLYKVFDKQNFIEFINSIKHPCIQYVSEGKSPTEADFLITADTDWCLQPHKKRRNMKAADLECHLVANRNIESDIYLFSDPRDTGGIISVKAHMKISIMINPKHKYFYQMMIQQFVIKSFFSPDIETRDSPIMLMVSAFFRQRGTDEIQVYNIGNEKLPSNTEVPIILIITPVIFHEIALQQSVRSAMDNWTNLMGKII